ncbi:MATE family efflux transporter [Pelagovum pacificum]|uniref:Multidrug-efflux transporter n=2 Tax=Pelagovum pacificum TaxID=2588711 RepID=A0A5C5GKP4_9RHOB|nr:MATE family efflux transporter [Pelagovum pacificum]QQA44386.1 MATE family efflux transporter [Pelagovum pacificum]TNY34309.1 MATE family efflux transporter [Pelagovum pacificum]
MATGARGHARALLTLGLPLVGSNVAQIMMAMADTLMLGWYDVTALAASTLAVSLWILLFLLGAGFSNAVMTLVAAALEEDDAVTVRRVTRMGLWLSLLFALPCLPLFWWSEPLFLAMGQEPDVAALAQDYLRIHGFSMFPAMAIMALRAILTATEHTRIILWGTIVAALLNAGLNWVLIFGNLGFPELGIRGAAIATLILQIAGALLFAVYALVRMPEYDLFTRLWKPDWPIFARVFRLGVPIGLTTLAEAGLFNVSAVMMGWIGKVPLAAHGIVMELTSMAFMIHLGFSQAATVRAGRAYGRRDEAQLRSGATVALAITGGLVAISMCLFLLLPAPLVGLFVDPDDPLRDQILATGVTLLAVAALFQAADAAQVMTVGLLRGVQDTSVPMVIAIVTYWGIGLPAGYLFAFTFGMGAIGVWLGMALGLMSAAVALSWRFWRNTRRFATRPLVA